MLTLQETAQRLARLSWIEARLFEVLGGWVPTTSEAEVKLLFATQSYHHAWHAQVLGERFPQGYGLDLDELARATPEALLRLLHQVAALEETVDRLVGVGRVLVPRLMVAYRQWLAECSPAADGVLAHWLGHLLADEVADWQALESALQGQMAHPDTTVRAATVQSAIESGLAVVGGLLGGLSGSSTARQPGE